MFKKFKLIKTKLIININIFSFDFANLRRDFYYLNIVKIVKIIIF